MASYTGNFGGVFLARSFGFRDLTESLVVLAPGLALLLQWSSPWRLTLLNILGVLLATWNLLLVAAYSDEILPQTAGASLSTLGALVWGMVRDDPTVLVLACGAPALVALLGAEVLREPKSAVSV